MGSCANVHSCANIHICASHIIYSISSTSSHLCRTNLCHRTCHICHTDLFGGASDRGEGGGRLCAHIHLLCTTTGLLCATTGHLCTTDDLHCTACVQFACYVRARRIACHHLPSGTDDNGCSGSSCPGGTSC